MENRLNKVSAFLILITIIAFVTSVACFFAFSDNEDTKIHFGQVKDWEEGWVDEAGNDVTLPIKLKGEAGDLHSIFSTLPNDINDGEAIEVRSDYAAVQVKIDGQLRYEYGKKAVLPFGHMTGNIKCIVPITKEDAGKSIELCYRPYFTQAQNISVVKYGDLSQIKYGILYDNLLRFISMIVMSVFAWFSIFYGFIQCIIGMDRGRKMLIYFGVFVLLAASWIVCSSDMPQIYTSANEAVSFMSYLSLAFMGVPFMAFCAEVFPHGKNHFYWMIIVGCANTLLVIILFVLDIVEPPQILITSHIYFAFVMLIDLYFSFKKSKENASLVFGMRIANVIVIGFALAGLISYYVSPTNSLDAIFFSIGFLLFIVILFNMLVYFQVQLASEITYVQIYKKMAFNDEMTGVGNRAAFDEEYNKFVAGEYAEYDAASLIVMDINNLKVTNDNIGHREGDELIKATARCVVETFKEVGDIFRIGGDEFAVVILGDKDIDGLLKTFYANVEKNNVGANIPVSVASGFSQFNPNHMDDSMMRRSFQEADDRMYENKQKMKSE